MQQKAEWQDEIIQVNQQIALHSVNDSFLRPLFALVQRNKALLQQAMDWPQYMHTPDDLRKTLQGNYLLHHRGYAKMYLILVDGRLAGVLSFNQIEPTNKVAYIGYWLDQAQQGQGVVSRALQKLMRHYAARGEVRRFVIKCIVSNEASNRVARRNGFILEGCLKQAEFLNGSFHDQHIYGRIIDVAR